MLQLDSGYCYGLWDIRVGVEPVYPGPFFSLSDCEVAKSRKVPRKVSTKEFVAQQNEFWGSIRRVGHADPRCLTLNSILLSARSLVPRLGTSKIGRKGSSAHACEETKGGRVCFGHYWLSQSLIFEFSIKDRLKKLGWTDIVTSFGFYYRLLNLPEVRKPEPLTPTGE